MPNLTLSIPDDLKEKLERFPEINWSEVARQAFVEKLTVLEKMQRLLAKSTLKEDETILIGRQIKRTAWNRHHPKH